MWDSFVDSAVACPGQYCGRVRLSEGNYSICSACPRGYRSSMSVCVECTDEPTFYDWLFLGFMAMLPLILHWCSIDVASRRRRYRACDTALHSKRRYTWGVLLLHLSALVETSAAALFTILLVKPRWTLEILSCKVQHLSDWYTMLHNPSPDYEATLYCTQEAVYPLYTMVLIYYASCLTMMLLLRPWVASKCLPGKGKLSIYAAMYFLPILTILHAICGGLLYYAFPYITIILSVISSAAHFACQLDQSMKSLILTTIKDIRNFVILLGHWLLHAYGIIAITQLKDIPFHAGLISLVPLPALFYIFTARFTDPGNLHLD
ncbi:hypothetical protein CHUAL_010667 [Chamberlinius hualienensis]